MKIFNKILCVVTTVAMLAVATATTSFAANPTFTATPSSETVEAGGTVDVTFALSGNTGLANFDINVSYPEGFSIAKADTTVKELSEWNMNANSQNTANPWTFSYATASMMNSTENGKIVKLTFNVAETVTAGTYEISMSYNPNNVYDEMMENVTVDCVSAIVTVPGAEKAEPTVVENTKDSDADANGNVTKGYLVSATVSAETKAINGITVTAASNGKTKSVPYTFTTVTDGTVKVAVNVLNVPSTATVDFSYALSTVAE